MSKGPTHRKHFYMACKVHSAALVVIDQHGAIQSENL